MTATQTLAVVLYSIGAVFAIVGPLIAAVRVVRKYSEAKHSEGGYDMIDALGTPEMFRPAALREAVWGIVEFGFVALGVVLASIASIILVVPN